MAQAKNLMRQQLFQIAALCFQKADEPKGMLEALAMHFYQPSAAATDVRPADRLLRAARCFELAGHTLHAASCLKRAAEYPLAAAAFHKLGRPVAIAKMLASAAEKASSRREAVEHLSGAAAAWEEAGKPTQAMLVRLSHRELQAAGLEMLRGPEPERDRLRQVALPHLEARKLYDAALLVAQQLGMDAKVEELARTSAFAHLRRGDKVAMFAAVKRFGSSEVQIAFLRQHGERQQVVEMLEEQGFVEQANDERLIAGDDIAADHLASAPSLKHDEPRDSFVVPWLSRAFRLCKVLSGGHAADGLEACLQTKLPRFLADVAKCSGGQARQSSIGEDSALQKAGQLSGGGESQGWLDLSLFMVFDALHDALQRAGVTAEHDGRLLEWSSLLVRTLRRVLAAEADELRRHVDVFLRLRGSARPLPRMPSWRWLCARTAHDAKQTLISGSEKLRALLEQAVVTTTTAWLEHFPPPALGGRLRTKVLSESRGPPTAQLCSADVSTRYVELIWLELRVHLDAKAALTAADALAAAGHRRAALRAPSASRQGSNSSGKLAYLYKRETAIALAGRVVLALCPEASRDRTDPDALATLPYATHPLAQRTLVRLIAAAHTPVEQDARALLGEWLQARYKGVSLPTLLRDLEPTAVQWRVLSAVGGLRGVATFKARVQFIEREGSRANIGFPTFELGGQTVHVATLLRTLSLFESAGDLRAACQPAVDYLKSCATLVHAGVGPRELPPELPPEWHPDCLLVAS